MRLTEIIYSLDFKYISIHWLWRSFVSSIPACIGRKILSFINYHTPTVNNSKESHLFNSNSIWIDYIVLSVTIWCKCLRHENIHFFEHLHQLSINRSTSKVVLDGDG